MPKVPGNNRLSAMRRLNNPYSLINNNNTNRNQTSFDARQLLNRQGSQTNDNGNMVVITGLKDMKLKDGRLVSKTTSGDVEAEKKKKIFAVGPSTFVTIRNNNNNTVNPTNEKFSFTKTITNASARIDDNDRRFPNTPTLSSMSDQKVVVSFVNDKYQKTLTPPPPTTTNSKSSLPTTFKRLHDASIQTVSSSSSVTTRSPIRMNIHRRQNSTMTDDDDYSSERTIADELDEPPSVKRTTSYLRKTTTDRDEQTTSNVPAGSVKRTSAGVPISSRISSSVIAVTKKPVTAHVVSTPGTILVTNLQSSVTEDDVLELFGDIGRITEIKTLSQGCIQITYAKREHSEQAVTKYHNRLLDGQFMYVSLQQPVTQSVTTTEKIKPTSKTTSSNNSQQSTKETGTLSSSSSAVNQPLRFNTNSSTKSTLDPSFIRQALFHPSNNSANPVQFQVKL